jgi:PAS domain S-box-containing protein
MHELGRSAISILYVEDDLNFSRLFNAALGRRYPEAVLHFAVDGQSGLEAFKLHRPEIVITDINMPVMDGIGMAAEIKALNPQTIIIAVTGHSDVHRLISAIEAGINHYLLKPIDFSKLYSVIDTSIIQINATKAIAAQNERLRKLSVAVEQSPSTVIITDVQGTIEYVNPRFTELTGFLPEEALGRNPRLVKSGATPAEVYQNLWQTVKSGKVWRGQLQNRKKNGELYWESTSISPVLDQAGTITHFVAVKEDITAWNKLTEELRLAQAGLERNVEERNLELSKTVAVLKQEVAERKLAEDSLLRLNRLFGTLYEANQAIIRAKDRASLFPDICGIIVDHGGFCMAWIGLVDRESRLVLPVAASGAGTEYLENIRISTLPEPDGMGPTGTAVREGVPVICNDFMHDSRTAPWHEKALKCGFKSSAAFALRSFGEAIGVITIYSSETFYFDRQYVDLFTQLADDISFAMENMEREQQSRQLELQLIQAKKLEAIGQIAGGVAHEVRNPLNAILSVTEALFNKKEIRELPKFEPFIQHIRAQVNRLAALMNDLLELGKPILVSNLQSVPLGELCLEVVKLFELSDPVKRRRIEFFCTDDASLLCARADRVKLQQVLINLIENSLQHTPPEAGILLQLVGPGKDAAPDAMAVLRICDTGSGIRQDNLERVFEPFYTGREGGTGLGLALVKHYVDYMGGTVAIWNNDPPPGCTAEVRLPPDTSAAQPSRNETDVSL